MNPLSHPASLRSLRQADSPSGRGCAALLRALLLLSAGCWSAGWAVAQTATVAVPTAAPAPAVRLQVREFLVQGNTLLPAETVQAVLQSHLGLRSLDELKQAAFAVQELYRQAGYGAVIAYLPEQSPADGRALIQVLEGRISRVEVSGNQAFSEANILRSLPLLRPGQTPQVQRIDGQIRLANENPAKQVAVSLEPGQQQGEVDARIVVNEQSPQRWSLGLDNTGNASTGRLRATLGYQHAALWDLDHGLALSLQIAPEKPRSLAVLSANYRIPIYSEGMSLDLFAAHSNVDGGSTGTAAGALQFSGRGEVLGLRFNKHLPRLGDFEQRFQLGLDRRAYLNDCEIAGLPPGACGSAGESVTVHPLLLQYSLVKEGENSVALDLSLARNMGLGGRHGHAENFEAVRLAAARHYSSARASLLLGFGLANLGQLHVRIHAQHSPDALVAGEQFGLGGASSVRGYEERELLGDSGVALSLEWLSPDFAKTVNPDLSALRALVFVDGGRVSNRHDLPCLDLATRCSLASYGLGARLGLGAWQLRFDLAQALRAGARTARRDWHAHFQLNYSFS